MKKLFISLLLLFVASTAFARVMFHVFAVAIKEHKILNPIIRRIFIYMVNNLARLKESTNMLLHNVSMTSYVSSTGRMRMSKNLNVFKRSVFSLFGSTSKPVISLFSALRNPYLGSPFGGFCNSLMGFRKFELSFFSCFISKTLSYISKTNLLLMFSRLWTTLCLSASNNIRAFSGACLSTFETTRGNMKFFTTYNTLFSHKLSFLTMILLFNIVCCQDVFSAQWDKTVPLSTAQWTAFPAASLANNTSIDRILSNYREGMTLTYSSATTISVTSGEVMVSNSDGTIRLMLQNASATDATFTNIDVGSESSATTYYIYAGTSNAADTTASFYISASSTAPTSVTYYKRLGSFYNDASSNISLSVTNDNNVYAPLFGAWTAKTVGTTYQALVDGFFTVFGCAYSVRGQAIYVYSDSSSSPTTLRGQYGSGSDQGSGTAITIPVRQGDYYKATFSSTDSCSATSYFVATK